MGLLRQMSVPSRGPRLSRTSSHGYPPGWPRPQLYFCLICGITIAALVLISATWPSGPNQGPTAADSAGHTQQQQWRREQQSNEQPQEQPHQQPHQQLRQQPHQPQQQQSQQQIHTQHGQIPLQAVAVALQQPALLDGDTHIHKQEATDSSKSHSLSYITSSSDRNKGSRADVPGPLQFLTAQQVQQASRASASDSVAAHTAYAISTRSNEPIHSMRVTRSKSGSISSGSAAGAAGSTPLSNVHHVTLVPHTTVPRAYAEGRLGPNVTVVLMNWQRAANVRAILAAYTAYGIIAEIDVLMMRADTTLNYQHPKVRVLVDYSANAKFGLSTRFIACLHARNSLILIQDDDVLLSEAAVVALADAKRAEAAGRLVGYWGRGWEGSAEPAYVMKEVQPGAHPIALTVGVMADHVACAAFFREAPLVQGLVQKESKPLWNGEDVFISFVSYKVSGAMPLILAHRPYRLLAAGRDQGMHLTGTHQHWRDTFVKEAAKRLGLYQHGLSSSAAELQLQATPDGGLVLGSAAQ